MTINNMKKKEERYIQFPLPMIAGLITDLPNTLNSIIGYGVYNYSKQMKCDDDQVCRQVIYDWYNDNLDRRLKRMIQALKSEYFGSDDDYRAFDTDGKFDPTYETFILKKHFVNDKDLEGLCKEHYRLHQAQTFLNVRLGSIDDTVSKAKKIEVDEVS